MLAGGVWLETMLAWLGLRVPIKCLVNQLVVTERMRPVMRSVVGIANGLLSLKQFENGSVLIGGGWQGIGDPVRGGVEAKPENLIGNVRLARHAIPALGETRVVRIWLGLEAETADAMPHGRAAARITTKPTSSAASIRAIRARPTWAACSPIASWAANPRCRCSILRAWSRAPMSHRGNA